MNDRSPLLLVVAGEVSGDIHAANLLEALARLVPGMRAFGVGGERLQSAGLELLAHTDELAHMGLIEVLRELPRIRGILQRVVAAADARRPDLAVLVDSPDFNLRLAARLRQRGVEVVLYVSPQLWAWRRGRVRVVRRVASEVLCILPFEVDFYAAHGVPARFVGHPLVDDLARDGLLDAGLEVSPDRLALLPGSRRMEVRQLLPVMLEALATIPPDRVRDAVLVEAPGMASAIDEVIAAAPRDGRVRRVGGRDRRRELGASALAWTASGTATLECALLGVPMVIGYRLQRFSHLLARMLVRVAHVGLVNLIAEERVAPELLQGKWRADLLAAESERLLGGASQAQKVGLARVRERLGAPGASQRAAAAVAERITPG